MTAITTRWASFRLPKFSRPYAALLAVWTLSMISLPILRWVWGDAVLPWGVAATVLIQAGAVVTVLVNAWGFLRTMRVIAIVVMLAWLVEFVGSATGFPFGVYQYTDRLQPQLGHVPLLIPLAWLMMLPPAWALASCLVSVRRRLAFALVSAVALTAWDLFLDPQMVSWGFWQWANPAGYFGIPWTNFLGWLLASSVITFAARPAAVPVRPLLFIYAVTWLFMSIGLAFFWELPGPALVGFAAMGTMLAFALLALRRRGSR